MSTAAIIVPFVVALVVSAVASPLVGRMANALGVVDQPSARSVNRRPNIPLMGGLAVGLGFFVGLGVATLFLDPAQQSWPLDGIFIGGSILLLLGACDDRWGLRPGFKLVCQVSAAAVAIAHGFRIDQITDPVSFSVYRFPEWLVWVVTILWIVGITNALNLLDGLDGCTTGIAAIIAATLSVISWQTGMPMGLVIGTALAGALLGFLPFNFPPGRIFLGDTGALFIGYMVSLLSLQGFRKVTVLTFVVPLLALAVPILDTGLSILRRMRRRSDIFAPDKGHMHHRLLDSAGSQRSAVLSLYFLTVCFCVIAVSFTRLHGYAAIVFLVAVVALTIRMLRNLGLYEIEEPPVSSLGGEGS